MPDNEYGVRSHWDGFRIPSAFFLKTKQGKRVLHMEADATNPENQLALGRASRDLSLEDASQAFRQLIRRARATTTVPFSVMRVFLGDLSQLESTGAGRVYSLRKRIAARGEADVVVDSQVRVGGVRARCSPALNPRSPRAGPCHRRAGALVQAAGRRLVRAAAVRHVVAAVFQEPERDPGGVRCVAARAPRALGG